MIPPADNDVQSSVSISKMSVGELRQYMTQLDDFLQTPSAAAIRICECCIKVSVESPEEN
jgi:hypothetical protein